VERTLGRLLPDASGEASANKQLVGSGEMAAGATPTCCSVRAAFTAQSSAIGGCSGPLVQCKSSQHHKATYDKPPALAPAFPLLPCSERHQPLGF
jgi:hypothetical protein